MDIKELVNKLAHKLAHKLIEKIDTNEFRLVTFSSPPIRTKTTNRPNIKPGTPKPPLPDGGSSVR